MAYVFEPGTLLARRELWQGSVGRFGEEDVRLADGRELTLAVLKHPGACAVVPLLPDGRVVLLRQYRWAVRDTLWEVPAGKLDAGEALETCARRELREETGYDAGELVALGSLLMTPGFCDERIHLYLARELRPGPQRLAHDESLQCTPLPFEDAVGMAERGEICDAKSVTALLRARAWLARERDQVRNQP
ncbi:MAG TPA: NUDIX hydrolase [Polyangiales bacterium]|nr:NUDIX hydrolase [Polyangiales bacterium]